MSEVATRYPLVIAEEAEREALAAHARSYNEKAQKREWIANIVIIALFFTACAGISVALAYAVKISEALWP